MATNDQNASNRRQSSSARGRRRSYVDYLWGPGPAQGYRPTPNGYLYGSLPNLPGYNYYGPGYGYSGPGYGWGYGYAGPPYGYGGNYWPGYAYQSLDASYGPGDWFNPTGR